MKSIDPAAPETKSARPATNADPIAALTRTIDEQGAEIQRIARQSKSTVALARLNEAKQRALEAVRASQAEQDRLARKGRPDLLVDDRMRRQNATIDRANDTAKDDEIRALKAANLDLRKKSLRPHGPTGNAPSGKAAAMSMYRKCLLDHLKTGATSFAGQSLQDLERKALSGQSNPDGGYLLHPEYDMGPMEKLLLQYVPMRQLATVRPISAASLKKAVSLRGRGAKWVGEVDARPATATPQIAELEYPAMELYAEPLASQSLLEDGIIDIEGWLAEEVIDDFAMSEAEAFTYGDGIKKPFGLLSYPKVAWTAGYDSKANFGKTPFIITGKDGGFVDNNAAANIGSGDVIVQMPYTLKQGYRQNAGYMANRGTIGRLRSLKDAYGRYLWSEGDLSKGQPNALNGYTMYENEQMPDMAAGTFALLFGDIKRTYIIVDRLGMNVLRDPYSSKPYVMFYTRKRVGGGIQNFEAMTLLKASAA